MGGEIDCAKEGPRSELDSPSAALGRRPRRFLSGGTHFRAALLGWLPAFVLGACSLLAGDKGTVTGIVAGPSAAPIPGAKVTLVAVDGSRQSVTADQRGHYSFPSVDPATYTLCAEAAGYQTITRTDVRVMNGLATTVDLRLPSTVAQEPKQGPPAPPPPSYYEDMQLKPSAVTSASDAAGYSSQAQSPQRLLREGPSLAPSAPRTGESANPVGAAEERRLLEVLRANPDSFEANHQLGEYYLSINNAKEGIPYLEKAQELQPGSNSTTYDLALAYFQTQRFAKTQGLLRDLIRREDSAELHNLLGRVEEALGNPALAVKEFQLAAKMEPSEKNIFDWGNELLLHDRIEPATEVLKRGVALYPNSLPMYVGLGIALYSANSYDAAIEALCRASDLDPSDPRPYIFLGKMYAVPIAHADEVAKRMNRFMETNPHNALAFFYGALSVWKGSRSGEQGPDAARVEALFRKSITLDPRLADAHLQLGILYYDQHRDQEAIQELQAATRLNSRSPDAHYRLAQAYLRTGEKKRAEEEVKLYEKLHRE